MSYFVEILLFVCTPIPMVSFPHCRPPLEIEGCSFVLSFHTEARRRGVEGWGWRCEVAVTQWAPRVVTVAGDTLTLRVGRGQLPEEEGVAVRRRVPVAAAAGPRIVAPVHEWTCPLCTRHNLAGARMCASECGAWAPAPAPAPAAAATAATLGVTIHAGGSGVGRRLAVGGGLPSAYHLTDCLQVVSREVRQRRRREFPEHPLWRSKWTGARSRRTSRAPRRCASWKNWLCVLRVPLVRSA
jgi:hypothetical protein